MKKNKLVITITIIVIFIINILLNYLTYRKFTNITNNFVASIINEISVNYPNIDDTEIIEIINSSDYNTNSDILTLICSIVSLSRIVTVSSSKVSKSTVTQ